MSKARKPSPLAQGVVYSPKDTLTKLFAPGNNLFAAMSGGDGGR